jgi:hypothetical protein
MTVCRQKSEISITRVILTTLHITFVIFLRASIAQDSLCALSSHFCRSRCLFIT